MTLDPSYRIQIAWNGKHFLLYVRSLIDGVLFEVPEDIDVPFFTQTCLLQFPQGTKKVEAFRLEPDEAVDFLMQEEFPAIAGGDVIWLQSVSRWILTLFRDEFWFPEATSNGSIQLNLLTDAAEIRNQVNKLKMAMPRSVAAGTQGRASVEALWQNVTSELAQAIGWKLLTEEEIHLDTVCVRSLPKAYQSLLQDFLGGRKNTFTEKNFFDSRQASLALKQQASRLAFRLVEPKKPGQTWQIRPQLQHVDDPTSFVDALEAWESPGNIPSSLVPKETSPRLHLLREFGRALRLFPVLGASLATTPPSPLTYDDEEMAAFLSKNAEVLRSYGYEIIANSGLNKAIIPEASLRLDHDKAGIDLDQLLDFHWRLVVDDALLDLKQLEAWAENPSSLFFSNGRWFWLDTKKTLKLLKFVNKQPKRGTLLEAMQYAADVTSLKLDFGGDLAPLSQAHRFEELTEPVGFQGQLRDYQRRGFSWLMFMQELGLGACLADDMGLGKTIQTLALFCHLKKEKKLGPALLICPTSVLGNWQREASRFAPDLVCKLHHGERSRKLDEFKQFLKGTDIVLTSYALLTRDKKLFLDQEWQLIVLDEAQQIKNPSSKVSQLSHKLTTKGRLILTGTPVENRLRDLWTLFRFLQPELLGSKRRFQSRFTVPIEKKGNRDVRKQLRRLVGPFILRRTKMDPNIAAELPPRVDTTVECSLTPEQAQIYENEVKEALQSVEGLEGFERKGSIVRLLTRLKQLCDHPALLEEKGDWEAARSGKLHRLFEILKELAPTEGILLFSQFTQMLRPLKSLLTESFGEEVLLLDGSTPREDRDQMVERFQSGIGPRIFCLSLKAGGVGLNLTRASSVIHFDRWWNPAVEAQATDRAHRIGQKKTVQVFKFVTQHTLEEQIARILQSKQALMEDIIEEGDNWLTELNDRELSDLLLPSGRKAVPS